MKFSYEDLHDTVLCGDDYPEQDLTVVQLGEWKVSHKMQYREIIFSHADKHYSVVDYRDGNDFQGWERVEYMLTIIDGLIECDEVVKAVKTYTTWVGLGDPDAWTYAKAKEVVDSCEYKWGDGFINKKNGHSYSFDMAEIHSETLEPMVAYYDTNGIRWTRPYDLFFKKFEHVK